MALRSFTEEDGVKPVDLLHSGLDHLTASKLLFNSDPSHFDSAGYLAHMGVELLFKSWIFFIKGSFKGTHNLKSLYHELVVDCNGPRLEDSDVVILEKLDQYESLRYPNRHAPTEVGDDEWPEIEELVGKICRSMPRALDDALSTVVPGHKGGRILMRRKKG